MILCSVIRVELPCKNGIDLPLNDTGFRLYSSETGINLTTYKLTLFNFFLIVDASIKKYLAYQYFTHVGG